MVQLVQTNSIKFSLSEVRAEHVACLLQGEVKLIQQTMDVRRLVIPYSIPL